MAKRRTLAGEVFAEGVTLHAGVPVHMRLAPAPPGDGIAFRRSDVPGSALIPALWSNVAETRLGTVLKGPDGTSVGVVEHLLSAAAGIGIDDCLIEIDGPEPPILDGDALSFVRLFDKAGLRDAVGPRDMIRVLREVRVAAGDASARLLPATESEFFFEIEFPSAVIGRQTFQCPLTEVVFRRDIAPARTFGFLHEADALRAAGYGRGAGLTNTLVIDGNRLLNPELRRFPDEFVRHKILDAVGDLKLAGAALIARFEGYRSSHTLNNALLRALFAGPALYERVQS
ncbi:MAG TPA: UDP-3-O-acyl-N-acetylglucosamine deacetylase [Micropepsaceae bacterium]|nr:UDP-3-O-acyl-N-acetylglucosamine deacetylase [Micropepsaceae bacterium]